MNTFVRFTALMVALTSCGAFGAAAVEPIRLKFAFFASDREYAYQGVVKPFVDAVNLDAKGIVDINLFPGGTLGRSYMEQAQLVLDGTADLAWLNPSLTPERFPDNAVLELPGLFRDASETSRVYTRLVAANVLRGYENFVVVAAVGTRPLAIHMQPPISSLEDLRGKKIRSLNATEGQVLRALGMVPEVMPINRTAEAINRGTIDGSTAPPAVLIDFGIARFAKHHYFLDLGAAPLLMVMNRKRFDGLPMAGQDAIRKYSGEWTATRYIQATESYDRSVLEPLKADPKRTIVHPSAAELETAGTAFKTVIDAWTMRDRRNPQLLKLVHAELARLRGGH